MINDKLQELSKHNSIVKNYLLLYLRDNITYQQALENMINAMSKDIAIVKNELEGLNRKNKS